MEVLNYLFFKSSIVLIINHVKASSFVLLGSVKLNKNVYSDEK